MVLQHVETSRVSEKRDHHVVASVESSPLEPGPGYLHIMATIQIVTRNPPVVINLFVVSIISSNWIILDHPMRNIEYV